MTTVSLLSWNVNGIRAAVRNGFADFLKKKHPDVLGIQEIKIDNATRAKTAFDFKGYAEFWNPAERPGYSGTASLISETSTVSAIAERNGIGIPAFDAEGRVQTTEFSKFFFVNAYFPNANDELSRLPYKQRFNAALLAYARRLEKKKPVVMCGDFNVAHQEMDLKNPKQNRGTAGFTDEERGWMDKYIAAGFVDTFRTLHPNRVQYSWWTYRFKARERNVGWRIDYFLVSKKFMKRVRDAYILDSVMGSDHCPVGIDIVI